jgi:hypothetical protein
MSERAIRIEADGVRLYAILRDTPAAALVWDALPIEGRAKTSAQEVCVEAPPAAAGAAAGPQAGPPPAPGDLAYRASDRAVVLVFAPPVEAGGTAARGAVVFGRITGDASRLARVKDGSRVRLTALEG